MATVSAQHRSPSASSDSATHDSPPARARDPALPRRCAALGPPPTRPPRPPQLLRPRAPVVAFPHPRRQSHPPRVERPARSPVREQWQQVSLIDPLEPLFTRSADEEQRAARQSVPPSPLPTPVDALAVDTSRSTSLLSKSYGSLKPAENTELECADENGPPRPWPKFLIGLLLQCPALAWWWGWWFSCGLPAPTLALALHVVVVTPRRLRVVHASPHVYPWFRFRRWGSSARRCHSRARCLHVHPVEARRPRRAPSGTRAGGPRCIVLMHAAEKS